MDSKKIATIIMIVFVVVSIGHLVYRLSSGTNVPVTDQSAPGPGPDVAVQASESSNSAPGTDASVVYYFMTTQRCPSCQKIEAYTKAAVEENFGSSLQDKSLVWKMVNVDEPDNRHFIKDYELYTKSVVLVKYRDGQQVKWKNLDRVWSLLNDEAVFRQYIADEVTAFFQEG